MVDVTDKELRVLKAIRGNNFHNDHLTLINPVWADCIHDSKEPSGVTGKAFSGVVASLAKKGLIGTDGECISLTAVGEEVAR